MEDGNEIFLTQSHQMDLSINTTVAGECAENILDLSLDSIHEITEQNSTHYQPEVSDISDNELVLTCEQVEGELCERFGKRPVSDAEIDQLSKKR